LLDDGFSVFCPHYTLISIEHQVWLCWKISCCIDIK